MKVLAGLLFMCIVMSAYGQDNSVTAYPTDDGTAVANKATKWVAIKTSNAVKVASEVAITVRGISYSGDEGFLSSEPATASGANFNDFLEAQLDLFKTLAGLVFSIASTYRGTTPCDQGGSINLEWNDADNNQVLSQGDTFTTIHNQCRDAEGVYNGKVKWRVLRGEGKWLDEISPYKFQLALSMFNLSVSGTKLIRGSGTDVLNGDLTWTNSNGDRIHRSESFAGKSLTVKTTGSHRGVRTLTNYEVKADRNLNTRVFSLSGKGALNSTVLGGSVSFKTLKKFENVGDDYPYEGIMKITGAKKSNEKLITVDHRNVRLPVDANGDGVAERTLTTTWSKLLK